MNEVTLLDKLLFVLAVELLKAEFSPWGIPLDDEMDFEDDFDEDEEELV